MWKKLRDQQPKHDLLVVPVQFGLLHRGQSVRRARKLFHENEFGLCPFHVGTMLLTHDNRFQHADDLWIDCPGGEYDDVDVDARFACAPCYSFVRGYKVNFSTEKFSRVSDCYGSASGFLVHE